MKWSPHKLAGPGELSLHYFSYDTKKPGQTIILCGGVHGDEYTGIEVIHQLMERLPSLLKCGRVICYPCLNPFGARLAQRNLPRDGSDLNRSFPGRMVGSQSSRYAHAAWESIMEWEPNFVLDIHADSARSVPYAIVDRPVLLQNDLGEPFMASLVASASVMGCEVLLEYAARDYQRYGLQHSLAGSLVNFGEVAALTLEVGGRNLVDQTVVDQAIGYVCRLLAHLKLVSNSKFAPSMDSRVWLRSSTQPIRTTGIFVPRLAAGSCFKQGEVIAHIRSVDGQVVEELQAGSDGVVIAWRDMGWAKTGSVVGTLGEAID